jgi:hypothetical protein
VFPFFDNFLAKAKGLPDWVFGNAKMEQVRICACSENRYLISYRPASWDDHPVKKFVADLFYVNDVFHFRKDCWGDVEERNYNRTLKKWLLHIGKSTLFGLLISLVFLGPGIPIVVLLDVFDVVTWNSISMISLQLIIYLVLGILLPPICILFAIHKRPKKADGPETDVETSEMKDKLEEGTSLELFPA